MDRVGEPRRLCHVRSERGAHLDRRRRGAQHLRARSQRPAVLERVPRRRLERLADLGVTVGNQLGCSDIFVVGAHCYDTSNGTGTQLTDVTGVANPAIGTADIGGAIEGKVSAFATGGKGDTLRIFVNGPGHRLWLKKWKGNWIDWKQLPVTVNGSPACAMKKTGNAAVCLSIESDGTTKAILLGGGEI